MDKKTIKKTILKLLLGNSIVSVVVYVLYLLVGVRFPQPHLFSIMIVPYAITVITVITIVGFVFRFENKKETWIMCNVIGIIFGTLSSFNICFFDNSFIYVLVFPFTGVNMLCEFSIGMGYMVDWKRLLLCFFIFIICQNSFLLPMLIKDRIQKRKKGTTENILIDTKE